MTKKATKAEVSAPEMTAWDMIRSILAAFEQTHEKALEEYREAERAEHANPYAASRFRTRNILSALQQSQKFFESEMRPISRGANLDL